MRKSWVALPLAALVGACGGGGGEDVDEADVDVGEARVGLVGCEELAQGGLVVERGLEDGVEGDAGLAWEAGDAREERLGFCVLGHLVLVWGSRWVSWLVEWGLWEPGDMREEDGLVFILPLAKTSPVVCFMKKSRTGRTQGEMNASQAALERPFTRSRFRGVHFWAPPEPAATATSARGIVADLISTEYVLTGHRTRWDGRRERENRPASSHRRGRIRKEARTRWERPAPDGSRRASVAVRP